MAETVDNRFKNHPAVRLVDSSYHQGTDARLETLSGEEVHWLYRIGLGHMLYAESRKAGLSWPADIDQFLHSADLSARVLYEQAAGFLSDFLADPDIPAEQLTLLKGIAMAERYYHPPHHRLMGDIDILVEPTALEPVVNGLRRRGFLEDDLGLPEAYWAAHHHLPPRRHPDSGIWLEIHTGLFEESSPVAKALPFQIETVNSHREPVGFRNVATTVLNRELAMTHVIAHWAGDYRPFRAFSGLRDVAALLMEDSPLDWDLVLGWAEASLPLAKCMDLFFTLLDEFGWCRNAVDLSRPRNQLGNPLGTSARAVLKSSFWGMSLEGGSRWVGLGQKNVMTLWRVLLSERTPAGALAALPWQILYPSHDPDRFRPETQARRLRSLLFPDQAQD